MVSVLELFLPFTGVRERFFLNITGTTWSSLLIVLYQVFEVATSLFMVNVRKVAGDTLEYHRVCSLVLQTCAPGVGVICLTLSTDSYTTAYMVLVFYSCLVKIISIQLFLTLLHAHARL
jgi:hypothetical protein